MLIYIVYNPNREFGLDIFLDSVSRGVSSDTLRIADSFFVLSDMSLLVASSNLKILRNLFFINFTVRGLTLKPQGSLDNVFLKISVEEHFLLEIFFFTDIRLSILFQLPYVRNISILACLIACDLSNLNARVMSVIGLSGANHSQFCVIEKTKFVNVLATEGSFFFDRSLLF
jgi:hypothetical protein